MLGDRGYRSRYLSLAAMLVVLLAAHPAAADLTVNYTGKPFDPQKCAPTAHTSCLPGPIHESITFPGYPDDFTGTIDDENLFTVNSLAVEGASHLLPTPVFCGGLFADIVFKSGKVQFANVYIPAGDSAEDCNRRQQQINVGSIDQAAIYYDNFAYKEFGELDGGQVGTWTNGPYTCGDERDALIAEYRKYHTFFYDRDTMEKHPFVPSCEDFTQSAHSQLFTFNELNTGNYSWALIRGPLVAPAGSPGLDEWVKQYGKDLHINSAYRNPQKNFKYYKNHGEAKKVTLGSRHTFGDAADVANQSQTLWEYKKLAKAAHAAGANWIEKPDGSNGPCRLVCFHADWRLQSGSYQN